jgi:hypothetical protein
VILLEGILCILHILQDPPHFLEIEGSLIQFEELELSKKVCDLNTRDACDGSVAPLAMYSWGELLQVKKRS